MFTSTAVLQLPEAGALRLDDRADAWLDHLAGTGIGAATLRDLLGHGAGVSRDSADGDFWQLLAPFPDAAGIRCLTGAGADADVLEVAERFKYSNLGFGLLGLVIEAAGGLTFGGYVAARIAEPLGLTRAGADWDPARAGDFATGHTGLATSADGVSRLAIDPVATGALAPATGVYSTAEDLIRFAAVPCLGDPRLVPDAAKRRMQHPQWSTGRQDEDYGLGTILTTIGDRHTAGHSGGFPGHLTRTIWDPVDRFAVSILTNAIDGPASALAATVVRLVNLAAEVPAPARTAHLDRFTGRFANVWGLLDVVRLGGRLYALDPAAADPTDRPVHLTVEDDSTLRIGGGTGYGSYGEAFRYTWAPAGVLRTDERDPHRHCGVEPVGRQTTLGSHGRSGVIDIPGAADHSVNVRRGAPGRVQQRDRGATDNPDRRCPVAGGGDARGELGEQFAHPLGGQQRRHHTLASSAGSRKMPCRAAAGDVTARAPARRLGTGPRSHGSPSAREGSFSQAGRGRPSLLRMTSTTAAKRASYRACPVVAGGATTSATRVAGSAR